MAKKKHFQPSIPRAVMEELMAAMSLHPELGFNSPSDAVKRAVIEYTKQLKRDHEAKQPPKEGPEAGEPAENELVRVLSKYFMRKNPETETPPAQRKTR